MKGFLYAGICMLALMTPTMAEAQTQPLMSDPPAMADFSDSRIVSATAEPLDSRSALNGNATHYIEFAVHGVRASLVQLLIVIPQDLRVNKGVIVTDQSGKKVRTSVTIEHKNVIIDFPRPVRAGSTLKIALQGIKTSQTGGHNWVYQVFGKRVGMNQAISFGSVQIPSKP